MCDCRGIDRRSFLRTGAGVATVGALATFSPAAAGEARTQTFSGELTSPATPDWHYLPIRVPGGVKEIEVSYDFHPSDTGAGFSYNVVDIGIFDPSGHELGNAQGFRGWSGGARRSFTISRRSATPGYLAGPITAGVWNIVLGPYAIVPPGTSWQVTVTLHFGDPGPKFVAAPAPESVPGTGPGWYRGDLHLHTVHSDGKRTQPEMIAAARAAGLDFIGSSEHSTSSASYTWGLHAPPDFLVMNGEEVTTRSGHWLAAGLPAGSWIDWRYRAGDDQLRRFTDQVRAAGGLAIAAHPFNPVPSIRWEFGYDYAGIDAIEVWNGPWTGDDQTAVEHWHSMLVAGTFLPVVGNSDSHVDSQAVGLAQTVVRLPTLSTGEVIRAIRGGHAWVAESASVELTFEATLGGRTASCGDHLDAAPTDVVDVRLTASGVPGSVAHLRGPLGILAGATADESGRVTLMAAVPAGAAPFVRAEVRRPDDVVVSPVDDMPGAQMVALTNPIFLT
jgi:hypothetical protein